MVVFDLGQSKPAVLFAGVLCLVGIVVTNVIAHERTELLAGWYPWSGYSMQSPPVMYSNQHESYPYRMEDSPQLVYVPEQHRYPQSNVDNTNMGGSPYVGGSTGIRVPNWYRGEESFPPQYSQLGMSGARNLVIDPAASNNWNDQVASLI